MLPKTIFSGARNITTQALGEAGVSLLEGVQHPVFREDHRLGCDEAQLRRAMLQGISPLVARHAASGMSAERLCELAVLPRV